MDAPQLTDGTPVEVRALRGTDRDWLAAAVVRLSPASRYSRFLSPLRSLDEPMLHRLVDEVDGRRHVALVGILEPGTEREARSAVARYVRWPDDPAAAEMAVTVADVVQGRGLGRVMAAALAAHARSAGVGTFTAVVAADNTPSLRLLAGLGTTVGREVVSPGVYELRVSLG